VKQTKTFWQKNTRGKLHTREHCRPGLIPVELTAQEYGDQFHPGSHWAWVDKVCSDCAWYSEFPTVETVTVYQWV
jgi:hypothetical protein